MASTTRRSCRDVKWGKTMTASASSGTSLNADLIIDDADARTSRWQNIPLVWNIKLTFWKISYSVGSFVVIAAQSSYIISTGAIPRQMGLERVCKRSVTGVWNLADGEWVEALALSLSLGAALGVRLAGCVIVAASTPERGQSRGSLGRGWTEVQPGARSLYGFYRELNILRGLGFL